MTRSARQSARTPAPRGPRLSVGITGPGGATLAFLLLILCGVSGAAVLDPALGAWGAAISSRAENLRAARSIASESRLAGVRLDHPSPRSGVSTSRVDARLPQAVAAPDAMTFAMVRAGSLDLPPPTIG